MRSSRLLPLLACALAGAALASYACKVESTSSSTAPSGSEVAVSVVSGALNNRSGGSVAFYPRPHKSSPIHRALAFLNPVSVASAAEWSCTGAILSPNWDGPKGSPYAFTPPTCSVTWSVGDKATSSWSGPFTLNYGPSCNSLTANPLLQAANCDITRTTGEGGDTRSITGPLDVGYDVTHDTNGAGTGWDTSVVPAPTNDGVQLVCGSGGCASGANLVISGSHLTGTVTADGISAKVWDHTVTTDGTGITITAIPDGFTVSGSVTVQHNILEYVSTTTFKDVTYSEATCCFPSGGSVSTTFSKGEYVGDTETLSFSSICGESTYTSADGVKASLTLTQCL